MNTISMALLDRLSEARRQVEIYCQTLVDTGAAYWLTNENGDTELHLDSGEIFLLDDWGVTRLK